ncbi:MAG: hypothetical protein R3C42_02600 [Parvularculaceae bacterium]
MKASKFDQRGYVVFNMVPVDKPPSAETLGRALRKFSTYQPKSMMAYSDIEEIKSPPPASSAFSPRLQALNSERPLLSALAHAAGFRQKTLDFDCASACRAQKQDFQKESIGVASPA